MKGDGEPLLLLLGESRLFAVKAFALGEVGQRPAVLPLVQGKIYEEYVARTPRARREPSGLRASNRSLGSTGGSVGSVD